MTELVRMVTDYCGVDQAQAVEALVAIACVGGTALICRWIGLGTVATARVVGKVGKTVVDTCCKKAKLDPLCEEILKQLDDEVAMLDESTPVAKLEAGNLQIVGTNISIPDVVINGRNVFNDLNVKEKKLVKAKIDATIARVRERDRLMRRAESLAKLTNSESSYSPTITKNSPLRKS